MKKPSLFGINGLLLSNFLLQFGFSMVGIFVPLYIYKITHSFFWILGFFLLLDLIIIIFTLPTARLIAKFGSDKIYFTGAILRSIFLVLLILAGRELFFLIPAVFFWGLAVPFCWLPFHLSVVGTDHTLSFGKDVAKISFTGKVGSIAGPILGGIIIQTLSFNSLYVVSLAFVIISGLPLFFDRYEFKFPEITLKTLGNNLPIKQMPRLFLGFFGVGLIDRFQSIVWPIYVFLLASSYQFLGTITSISLLASFILLVIVRNLANRFGGKILKISVPINILNWLSRIFIISGQLSLFLVDLAYQLVSIFIWVPFDRLAYQTAVQTKKLEYFLSRELAIHFGSFVATMILIFSLGLFGLNWPMAFTLSALSLLFILQLGFAKEEGMKSAGVVLIRKDGSTLMILRDSKKDISFPNHWCMPGGKVEIGETPQTAAHRELTEETGYRAQSLNLLAEETYSLPSGQKITRHIFWTEYDENQELTCLEGQRIKFLKLADMADKKIFPGHKEFCQQALIKSKSL